MKQFITVLFLLMGLAAHGEVEKLVIPGGTNIMIKMSETVDTGRHNSGHKFTAILEGDLVVDGKTLVPNGSKVYGEVVESTQAGRIAGKSKLSIKLTQVMVENRLVQINTNELNYIAQDGEAKDTVGKTARAAAVGGLIDGKDGAKTGAKIGVGVAVLTRGGPIGLTSGTLLDFTIQNDVN